MAIAGGATTAYKLRLVDGKPVPERTTKLAYLCISPDGAVTMLRTGGSPTAVSYAHPTLPTNSVVSSLSSDRPINHTDKKINGDEEPSGSSI